MYTCAQQKAATSLLCLGFAFCLACGWWTAPVTAAAELSELVEVNRLGFRVSTAVSFGDGIREVYFAPDAPPRLPDAIDSILMTDGSLVADTGSVSVLIDSTFLSMLLDNGAIKLRRSFARLADRTLTYVNSDNALVTVCLGDFYNAEFPMDVTSLVGRGLEPPGVDEIYYRPIAYDFTDEGPLPPPDCPVNDQYLHKQYNLRKFDDSTGGGCNLLGAFRYACAHVNGSETNSDMPYLIVVDRGVDGDLWRYPDLTTQVNRELSLPNPDYMGDHGLSVLGVACAAAGGLPGNVLSPPVMPDPSRPLGYGLVGAYPVRDRTVLIDWSHPGGYIWALEEVAVSCPQGGVVTNSWGVFGYDQELEVIIGYLRQHRDMVIVASGGQETQFHGIPFDLWPAACYGVIAVAGCDSMKVRWGKSNYGYFIDLIAPAVNIFTMVSCSDMGGPPADCYTYQNGTSLAAPLVAAIAAWMRSIEPNLCAATVCDLLRECGDTAIWSPDRGWGLPDAEIAVTKAANILNKFRDTLIAGDVNQDWHINEGDVVFLANYLSLGCPVPNDLRLADVDSSCTIDISDLVWLIDYVYLGGPPPVIGCIDAGGEQNRDRSSQFPDSPAGNATVPTSYSLDQNFPNPFNPMTTIRFGLPSAGHVRLEGFNLLGQKVAILTDEILPAGVHEVVWDGRTEDDREVSSGLYFYRLETAEFRQSRKMLLIK